VLTDFEFMHDPVFLPSCWTQAAGDKVPFIIGVFECFGAVRRCFSKLTGREHGTFLFDTEGGFAAQRAVAPAYWVLLTVYGDDQGKLRRLFA